MSAGPRLLGAWSAALLVISTLCDAGQTGKQRGIKRGVRLWFPSFQLPAEPGLSLFCRRVGFGQNFL